MKIKSALLISLLVFGTAVFAGPNFDYNQESVIPLYQQNNYNLPTQTVSANQTLKGSVVTVPAGQNVQAVVTTPINSANITVGQTVSVALGSDFYYNGNLIAPAGSAVTGTAIEASKAKHGSIYSNSNSLWCSNSYFSCNKNY